MNKKFVFLGDSLFRGQTMIPNIVHNLMEGKHEVQNLSVLGVKVTKKLLNEQNSWVNNNIIFNYKPNVVVIMLGTNNVNDDNFDKKIFLDNYHFILNQLKEISNPEIYICIPPAIHINYLSSCFKDKSIEDIYNKDFLKDKDFSRKKEILRFLDIIDCIKQIKNVNIIDVFKNSFHKNYYIDDIHFSSHGRNMISHVIFNELKHIV